MVKPSRSNGVMETKDVSLVRWVLQSSNGPKKLWGRLNCGTWARNGLSAGHEDVRVAELHPRFRSAIHLKGGVIPLWHTDGRGCGNNAKQLKMWVVKNRRYSENAKRSDYYRRFFVVVNKLSLK
jgi:hypothetical protein